MCSLCGILGGKAHWTDSSGAPEVFGDRDAGRTMRRDRLDRAGLVNRVLGHYRLSLRDWAGSQYVLRSATGKTAMVDNLSQMWAEAEKMSGSELDPLDPELIADLTDR